MQSAQLSSVAYVLHMLQLRNIFEAQAYHEMSFFKLQFRKAVLDGEMLAWDEDQHGRLFGSRSNLSSSNLHLLLLEDEQAFIAFGSNRTVVGKLRQADELRHSHRRQECRKI